MWKWRHGGVSGFDKVFKWDASLPALYCFIEEHLAQLLRKATLIWIHLKKLDTLTLLRTHWPLVLGSVELSLTPINKNQFGLNEFVSQGETAYQFHMPFIAALHFVWDDPKKYHASILGATFGREEWGQLVPKHRMICWKSASVNITLYIWPKHFRQHEKKRKIKVKFSRESLFCHGFSLSLSVGRASLMSAGDGRGWDSWDGWEVRGW